MYYIKETIVVYLWQPYETDRMVKFKMFGHSGFKLFPNRVIIARLYQKNIKSDQMSKKLREYTAGAKDDS